MANVLIALSLLGMGCATIPLVPAPEPNTVASTPVQAQAQYLRGQFLVAKGDLEGGRMALQRARMFDPKAASIIMALARVSLTEGDTEQARALFFEAAETAENDPEAWLAAGRLEMAFGDADIGRSALKEAVKWGDPWTARASLIADALRRGLPPEGLDVWVDRESTDPLELRRRGELRLVAGDGPGAVNVYLRALELSGRDFRVVMPLVRTASLTSRVAHALMEVERTIERQPSATAALVCGGLLSGLVGDVKDTVRYLERAMELGAQLGPAPVAALERARLVSGQAPPRTSSVPEPESLDEVTRAVALVDAGRFEEAEAVIAQRLKGQPNDPRLLYIVSEIYLKRDGLEAAEPRVEHLLASHPNFAPALNLWAWIQAERVDKLEQAEVKVRQALHQQAGVGAYWDTLGWVLHLQDRHTEARRALLRARRLSPEDDTVLLHLEQCRGSEELVRP